MRERYLDVFDAVRIDNLNGDSRRTGKVAPDGSVDPSVFSTDDDPIGIQVGTAVATLIRRPGHQSAETISLRNLWGAEKRAELIATSDASASDLYREIEPVPELGLQFVTADVREQWLQWPSLPDLFPKRFPGVNTSRDRFLVAIDREVLEARIADYFDDDLTDTEIDQRYPVIMNSTKRYDAARVRKYLLGREEPGLSGLLLFAYLPLDQRWLYWEAETKLLDERRVAYRPHVFRGNLHIVAQQKPRREWSPPQVITSIGAGNLMDRGASAFPMYLRDDLLGNDADGVRRNPNLSPMAQEYLNQFGLGVDDLFHHAVAVMHDPVYREVNAGGLKMGWPRIPLPDSAEALQESAEAEAGAAAGSRRRCGCSDR